VLVLIIPVLTDPLLALDPDKPPPVIVQEVALVEDHVSKDEPLLLRDAGEAEIVAVGGVPNVTVTDTLLEAVSLVAPFMHSTV
jgi:hypothetical protein